jgi:hypothetical protein
LYAGPNGEVVVHAVFVAARSASFGNDEPLALLPIAAVLAQFVAVINIRFPQIAQLAAFPLGYGKHVIGLIEPVVQGFLSLLGGVGLFVSLEGGEDLRGVIAPLDNQPRDRALVKGQLVIVDNPLGVNCRFLGASSSGCHGRALV